MNLERALFELAPAVGAEGASVRLQNEEALGARGRVLRDDDGIAEIRRADADAPGTEAFRAIRASRARGLTTPDTFHHASQPARSARSPKSE